MPISGNRINTPPKLPEGAAKLLSTRSYNRLLAFLSRLGNITGDNGIVVNYRSDGIQIALANRARFALEAVVVGVNINNEPATPPFETAVDPATISYDIKVMAQGDGWPVIEAMEVEIGRPYREDEGSWGVYPAEPGDPCWVWRMPVRENDETEYETRLQILTERVFVGPCPPPEGGGE